MSDTLSFNEHIKTVSSKVWQKCAWIIRTFHAIDMHTMKILCWYRVGDIQKIESLFRSFSSRTYPISDLNYWDQLSALKMYTQERRMKRYRIIYIWKILEGIAPSVGIKSYTSTWQGCLCQVPQIKQCKSGKIRAIREGNLQIRGPPLFDSLQVNICSQTGCSLCSHFQAKT